MSSRVRWKFWPWFAAMLAIVFAFYNMRFPFDLGRIIWHAEPVYDGQPVNYWRNILREDGRAGAISERTREELGSPKATTVLLRCVEDSDPNVRWPAVNLLGRFASPRREYAVRVLPWLIKALKDENEEVCFQAVLVIARMGPSAQEAVPELVRLYHEPDLQISHYADVALWQIDPSLALETGAWKMFTYKKWGFSATFPAMPE